MRIKILILGLLFSLSCIATNFQGTSQAICNQPLEKRQYTLKLSYEKFDQSNDGWRPLIVNHGHLILCFAQATKLIENYLLKYPSIPERQKTILYFHAGQNSADNGNKKEAMNFMRKALLTQTAPQSLYWNNYVNATIAFLNDDKKSLLHYQKIMSQSPENTNNNFLIFIHSFVTNFGKPYIEAYRD